LLLIEISSRKPGTTDRESPIDRIKRVAHPIPGAPVRASIAAVTAAVGASR
jgi:hypothetical protein